MSSWKEVAVMSNDRVSDVCRLGDVGEGVCLVLLHLVLTIPANPVVP